MNAHVVLSADDYAISPSVSEGILELVAAGRLSATAAMVTWPGWPAEAAPLVAEKHRVAIGLHLNLTAGAPLGPMPRLAPSGALPSPGLFLKGGARGADVEIAAEIGRQLDRFEDAAGMVPDFVDGHHHVHIFPPVRRALIAALRSRYPGHPPLVRDPGDRIPRILARRHFLVKAAGVAWHARGLARDLAEAALPTNDGFSGFSGFSAATPYDNEIDIALVARGARPLMMCHPGRVDAMLGARDTITHRRVQELEALLARRDINAWLWRCRRDGDGRVLWWP